MSFKSEPALKVHKVDKHGLGGKKLDLNGRDVHMLSQHARQQLSNAGVLRPSPGPFRVRSRGSQATPPPAAIPSVGGPEEMAQANKICEQMMRLVLQTDVFIRHDGKMKCSGIEWTRISVAKQITIVDMFDGICNLPKKLQYSEYVPPPLTFNKDYQCRYPVADFKLSPEQNDAQPALKIVAIYCSKVVLENNNLEAVKIAAVDVVTCRILMNHLVCTDSKNLVKDWCTESTGLNGYQDIEAARQDGYKVLKGWTAARTAMWNFIDRDTIIVGHSVRSDLDCLRMIHGRAVDVAKTFENAAKKELLPKQQLSLESLCRDLPAIKLTTHPSFGRDALQNAFAARELGLWMLKYPEKLEKTAKAKAAEFRRFAPVSQA
ncbi:hypothetical protein K504DRAFT_464273 [Pleomassaria siparia CBS 279.74]|uniref:Exonuclease domain-containing protein n=1 Tax=Pleomassaria siparia CBS 279.74 TaxID=1314801 RepID=A0A6G1KGZ5_9PLEO|nr:hypothetical protein K504DRAFT_464273 [Pleomassaria siparia CBS 279.74]